MGFAAAARQLFAGYNGLLRACKIGGEIRAIGECEGSATSKWLSIVDAH